MGGGELDCFSRGSSGIRRRCKVLESSLGPLRLRAPRGGFTNCLGPKPLTNGGGEVAGKDGGRPPASQPRALLPTRARHSLCARQSRAHLSVKPAWRGARRKGRGEDAAAHDSLVRWRGNSAAPRGRPRPRPGGTEAAAARSAEVVSAGVGRGRGGGWGGAGATAVGPPRPSSSPRRAGRRRAREARGPVSPRRAVPFGSAGTGD